MSLVKEWIKSSIIEDEAETLTIGIVCDETGATADIVAGELFSLAQGEDPVLKMYVNKANGHLYFDVMHRRI